MTIGILRIYDTVAVQITDELIGTGARVKMCWISREDLFNLTFLYFFLLF